MQKQQFWPGHRSFGDHAPTSDKLRIGDALRNLVPF